MTRFFVLSFYDNFISSHIIATHKRHKAKITIINDRVGKLVIPTEAGIQEELLQKFSKLKIFITNLSFPRKRESRGVFANFVSTFKK